MATVVKAEISVKGKRLENFSSLTISQNIFAHHTFEVICRPDAFDSFSMTGESDVLEKVKDFIGKKIKIDIRPVGKDNLAAKSTTIFNGIILEVHGSKYNDAFSGSISLRGASMDVFLDSEHHCRSFEDEKLDDIVQKVLSDYSSNLFDKTFVASRYTEKLPFVVQYNETNLDFLARLAKTYGEWLLVTGDNHLFFGEPPSTKVNVLHGKDLLEVSFAMKLASLGFNYTSYNYFTENAIQKNSGIHQPNTQGYLKKSLSVSEDVFDHEEDVYYNFPLSKQGADKEVEAAVKTDKRGRVARLNSSRGTSDNCEIFLGCILKIDSTVFSQGSSKTTSSGEYRVISLHHSCDENGNYLNHFEAIPVGVEVPPQSNPQLFPISENQSAVVTETNDPEGMGRIRVRFFWQTEQDQSPWLRVITPYAGSNKGMFFIPEIGEEVLIGFENRNAEKPYVLGAHYNGKANAKSFTNNKNDLKVIQTRSGHIIKFDDKDGAESITITDKNGNIITLDTKDKSILISAPDKISLSAKEINISGDNKVTISSKEVSMTGDNKVTITSTQKIEESAASIEIKAKTGATISSGAKVDIKGVMVDVNGTATTNVKGGILNLN